jgi:hypothetical protein
MVVLMLMMMFMLVTMTVAMTIAFFYMFHTFTFYLFQTTASFGGEIRWQKYRIISATELQSFGCYNTVTLPFILFGVPTFVRYSIV